MTTHTRYDLIIVGAGLVGSSLALALADKSNLKIAVIERASPLAKNTQSNQRVVALGQVASRLLDELGVLSQLGTEHCHPYERMFVWDENSPGELSFSAAEQQQQRLGYMVDSVRCTWLLQQAMRTHSKVDAYYGTKLERLELTADYAGLQHGETEFSAPLLVAADGANSWLRQQAKIFTNHQRYHQRGIVACIETAKPHQDTAWQRFLSTGPLAVLPVADNQSSIVWSADDERADQLMGLTDREFEKAISDALQGKLGKVFLRSKRQSFELRSLQADSYFKRHIVLVGDAAHSIHPLAGQGANLGFKDIQSLVDLLLADLAAGVNKVDLGRLELLQKYQRARKADNEQTDFLMSALHAAYQRDSAWWLTARGLGMNWLAESPVIKRALVKQAMGL